MSHPKGPAKAVVSRYAARLNYPFKKKTVSSLKKVGGCTSVFFYNVFIKIENNRQLTVGNSMKESRQTIKLGKYRHFKGGEYQVIGTAKHSESLEVMVIYKPLYELEQGELETWVRPIGMFFDTKEHEGKTVVRFDFIEA